jgi:hypothetical protein
MEVIHRNCFPRDIRIAGQRHPPTASLLKRRDIRQEPVRTPEIRLPSVSLRALSISLFSCLVETQFGSAIATNLRLVTVSNTVALRWPNRISLRVPLKAERCAKLLRYFLNFPKTSRKIPSIRFPSVDGKTSIRPRAAGFSVDRKDG